LFCYKYYLTILVRKKQQLKNQIHFYQLNKKKIWCYKDIAGYLQKNFNIFKHNLILVEDFVSHNVFLIEERVPFIYPKLLSRTPRSVWAFSRVVGHTVKVIDDKDNQNVERELIYSLFIYWF
jgi:hypothetical protein